MTSSMKGQAVKIDAHTLSLAQLQGYVAQTEKARGFDGESAVEKCLMLGEEVGELFKAVRACAGLKTDPDSEVREVAGELADVLNFLLAIANRFDIDLADAFAKKELINDGRRWTRR